MQQFLAAFDPLSSEPGPSFPSRPTHLPSSSSDFGAFESASTDHTAQRNRSHNAHDLYDDDLLGSFDDDQRPPLLTRRVEKPTTSEQRDEAYDSLTGIHSNDRSPQEHTSQSSAHRPTSRPSPIHITLPPRPTDISPDYVPPRRTPRRMSTTFSAFSPGSPPLVSDAGNEIVFHPTQQRKSDDAMSEMRKVQSATVRSMGHPPFGLGQPTAHGQPSATESPPHSKLLDTFATTSKMANKWKSALNQTTFIPPVTDHSITSLDHHSSPTTPLALDITHKTPFASAEQLVGSYTAPSGAPGFLSMGSSNQSRGHADEDWGHVKLVGRKASTTPVLTSEIADNLRKQLPPRQRLASTWTLLFSIDQHGASLNTLFRLVEAYGASHRTAGNVVVVQDGAGNRFGVYMNESITKREGTYYGGGESFLYKIGPSSEARCFRWTGKNQYFALCETDFISFGGGAGTYGLLLDNTFSRNSSATCPAYDNEILCDQTPRKTASAIPFDCVGLEVWGT